MTPTEAAPIIIGLVAVTGLVILASILEWRRERRRNRDDR